MLTERIGDWFHDWLIQNTPSLHSSPPPPPLTSSFRLRSPLPFKPCHPQVTSHPCPPSAPLSPPPPLHPVPVVCSDVAGLCFVDELCCCFMCLAASLCCWRCRCHWVWCCWDTPSTPSPPPHSSPPTPSHPHPLPPDVFKMFPSSPCPTLFPFPLALTSARELALFLRAQYVMARHNITAPNRLSRRGDGEGGGDRRGGADIFCLSRSLFLVFSKSRSRCLSASFVNKPVCLWSVFMAFCKVKFSVVCLFVCFLISSFLYIIVNPVSETR